LNTRSANHNRKRKSAMKCMLAGDCIETPAFAAKKKRKTKIRSEENKESPDAFSKKLREGQAKRLLELNNTKYNNRIPERKNTQRAILVKRYRIHQSVSRLYPLKPIFLENACDRDDARILRKNACSHGSYRKCIRPRIDSHSSVH